MAPNRRDADRLQLPFQLRAYPELPKFDELFSREDQDRLHTLRADVVQGFPDHGQHRVDVGAVCVVALAAARLPLNRVLVQQFDQILAMQARDSFHFVEQLLLCASRLCFSVPRLLDP